MRTATGVALAALFVASSIVPALAAPKRISLKETTPTQQRLYRLLKDQVDGKKPAPMTHAGMQYALAQFVARPQVRPDVRNDMKRLRLWVSDFSHSYMIGTAARGKKAVAQINTANNGCYFPTGIKVDHQQNLWIACEASTAPGTAGAVQVYTNGTLAGAYQEQCPIPSGCYNWYSYGLDVATDAAGNVFAPLAAYWYNYQQDWTTYGTGIEWWAPGAITPTLIPLDTYVNSVFYIDADNQGNLWIDYSGCVGSECGYGLAEIQTPTTTPTFVSILPVGTLAYPGGVYISNGGTVLNVCDQGRRLIQQYSLPSLAMGLTLGPTPLNNVGFGEPVSGGFSQGDVRVAFGDEFNWLDVGKVASNEWTIASFQGVTTAGGAAYVPSDK